MSLRARLAGPTTLYPHIGLLILRLWFGLVLAFGHGLSKLLSLDTFITSVGNRGIPLPEVAAPIAMLSEFLGGILLALGLFTRLAVASIVATMLVATFWVHLNDPFPKKEFALAYLVGALVILVSGPGRYSIDARR
jgi:putative oxidoreductase